MKLGRIFIIVFAVFFVIFFLIAFKYFLNDSKLHEQKPILSASIFPLYDIVKTIAGNDFEVSLLLPPGASPHTFDPTPATVASAESSDAIYIIGHGLDSWIKDLISDNSTIIVVDKNIVLLTAMEDEGGDGSDPHYWLTAQNGIQIAKNISEDLSNRFPEKANMFQSNLEYFIDVMKKTDINIRDILNSVQNKNIVTFHDAWFYFAKDYGLKIVGTYEPTAAREPTPRYLAELVSNIQKVGVKVIYSEPQFSTDVLNSILSDYDLSIAELDPIGGKDTRESFQKLLLYNANTIFQNQ